MVNIDLFKRLEVYISLSRASPPVSVSISSLTNMAVVNLYKSPASGFRLDFNTDKKRVSLGTSTQWVSLTASSLRILFTTFHCPVDLLRVNSFQTGSVVELIKLYDNVLLNFKSLTLKPFNTEIRIPSSEVKLLMKCEKIIMKQIEEFERGKLPKLEPKASCEEEDNSRSKKKEKTGRLCITMHR